MKYIKHSLVGFVIWQSIGGRPRHDDIAKMLTDAYGGKVVSAGFVIDIGDGPNCFGESGSLGIAAGEGDTDALRNRLSAV